MRERPCMLCGEPLSNDVCATPGCAYNPDAEMEVHEAEWQYDEKLHQDADPEAEVELPDREGEPDPFVTPENLPDSDMLEGDFEPEAEYVPDAEQKDAAKDADTLDISQENLPEPEGEKQLTQEDKGEDPSDDAHDLPEQEGGQDDDPDLPPRPQGCNGDCKPGDQYDPDADPCPHCTAKSFKEEMEQQGKENQSPEQMEEDWQNFLDNWADEGKGQGQGDQGDEGFDKQPEQDEQKGEMEEILDQMDEDDRKLEDRQPPNITTDDEDLPPKPQGCNGDCQPQDQYDMDADPCPHCTAKSFRDEMRREQELDPDLDPEKLAEKFQDFLQDWQNQQEEKKSEPEQNPDEIDEAPPEEEMQDGEPKEREQKKEREDDSDEFKRVGKDLTITQEKRFDNLMERIEKKVEQTFGQTAEDIFVMAKTEGQFQGEEISQSIQITSRGVTYWITLSAAKEV